MHHVTYSFNEEERVRWEGRPARMEQRERDLGCIHPWLDVSSVPVGMHFSSTSADDTPETVRTQLLHIRRYKYETQKGLG